MDVKLQKTVVESIIEAIAKQRITRATLASRAKIGLSTLEKGLSGQRPLSIANITRIEDVLNIKLRAVATGADTQIAPAALGAYSVVQGQKLVGRYQTIRPSFSTSNAIFSYETEIFWNEAANCLEFSERNRSDQKYAHAGHISRPSETNFVYFVTNTDGQHRLAVGSLDVINKTISGLLTTLMIRPGNALVPTSVPIKFIPIKNEIAPEYGLIASGHPDHGKLSTELKLILTDGYAILLSMP